MVANLSWITVNASGPYERLRVNGRMSWKVPFTSLVEGVLNGSKGALFYPRNEIASNPGAWVGVPVTLGHPTDPSTGQPQFARNDEAVFNRVGLGEIIEDRVEGDKRKGTALIDDEYARNKSPEVHKALVSGQPIELSTGLVTQDHCHNCNERVTNGYCGKCLTSNWSQDKQGRQYKLVARNYEPDHLALLIGVRGACSLRDGCGLGVNAEACACEKCVTGNSNPEGHNQYTGVGGLKQQISEGPAAHPDLHEKIGERLAGMSKGDLKEIRDHVDPAQTFTYRGKQKTTTQIKPTVEAISEHVTKRWGTYHRASMDDPRKLSENEEPMDKPSLISRMWQVTINAILGNSNPEGHNQYTGGGGATPVLKAKGKSSDKIGQESSDDANAATDKAHASGSAKDHKDAANMHRGAAAYLKGIGEHGLAGEHTAAAAAHDQEHAKAKGTTNAVPNQPRHAEKGHYLPPNGGTGKGEVHAAAVTGHRGKCDTCGGTLDAEGKCATCSPSENEGTSLPAGGGVSESGSGMEGDPIKVGLNMSLKDLADNSNHGDQDMSRKQQEAFLVANCDCWKGKAKLLENKELFDDATIDKLVKNEQTAQAAVQTVNAVREEFGLDGELALNEMPAALKAAMDAKAGKGKAKGKDDEEEPDEDDTTTNREGKKKMTVKDWFDAPDSAPPEVKSAVRNAMRIEEREKTVVVNKLTAHITDAQAKKQRQAKLNALTLDELYDRLGDMPTTPKTNRDRDDDLGDRVVNRFAQFGSDLDDRSRTDVTTNEDEVELLDTMAMNWGEKVTA